MARGREQVANFARKMLFTLNKPRNVVKPGWEKHNFSVLEDKLAEEYVEVLECLDKIIETIKIGYPVPEADMIRLSEECVDLANVCMMITDNVGGLKDNA